MKTHSTLFLLVPFVALQAGCDADDGDFRDCSTVDVSGAEALPARLSETGLYSDIANDVVSDMAFGFTPQFPLWTDTAKKRRWLLLPAGEMVDTRNPDDWVFPVGTQTFKEFTRDGVRIETRMNLKTEDGWSAATYLWNDAGDDATLQIFMTEDAAGTPHDVPGAAECQACHGGRRNFTLGFSATQLDVETRIALFEAGLLSDPVESEIQLDATARAGLGVLHGNCSHCHNSARNQQPQATDCYDPGDYNDFDFTLSAGLDRLDDAPAVRTAREQLGSDGDSKVLNRMSRRDEDDERPSMPPLGTELVDEDGVDAVRSFIQTL
ncbi:MAG: hypothetical protein AAFV53_27760 [Myxococcota bacterium]